MTPYRWELPARSFAIGVGTPYTVGLEPGPQGFLSNPAIDVSDVAGTIADGSSPGPDRYQARLLTIPVMMTASTPEATRALVDALKVGWKRLRTGELAMDACLPGDTGLRYYGRPRGVEGADMNLAVLHHRSLLSFLATDPLAYGAEVDSGVDASSPLTIPAAGVEATDRVTLTIAGNGGTPTVTNTTTGGTIVFNTVLAGGSSYVVDLHTRGVTILGVDVASQVSTASTWFGFDPAGNTITWTGAASVRAQYRPAYT